MVVRTATRPTRENDFSDVGKVGRRTGVTLPQGRLDANGMEEISGMFSSPRKPSPLRKSMSIMDSIENGTMSEPSREMTGLESSRMTPSQALSARKSLPPPRSASPRKSGISGTARRSNVVDVLGTSKDRAASDEGDEDLENQSALTPTLSASGPRRFSPEKTPLQKVTRSRPQTQTSRRVRQLEEEEEEAAEAEAEAFSQSMLESTETAPDSTEINDNSEVHVTQNSITPKMDEYILPGIEDGPIDQASEASIEERYDDQLLPPTYDDEEADQTFEPEKRPAPRSREPTVANSRKKRKTDAMDPETEGPDVISSPAAKRAKRISDGSNRAKKQITSSPKTSTQPKKSRENSPKALKNKDINIQMPTRQEKELAQIVEKVKARPGQKKSLYILRRETPTDDGMTHTRSGRVSVKPLAYWRNERCVFGGSPRGASLRGGERFPLNSIKEIIRNDEMYEAETKKSRGSKKGSKSNKKRGRPAKIETSTQSDGNLSSTTEEDMSDPEAEEWETERGIFKGPVSVWDPNQQAPVGEEEEIDLAYASASIETRNFKGSTFKYAKLLSSKFLGSGVVDLPPGSLKRPKNSRKMHMCFFVASGRVNVQVGPPNAEGSKFSVGQGGWWQVPRGNQYAMENNHSKLARIFFSQGCEVVLEGEDDE